MTPFEKLLENLFRTSMVDVWLVAKLGVLLLLFLYFLFSLVVLRQVNSMGKTVNGLLMGKGLEKAAKGLVGLAIAAFILGIVVL